MKNRNQHYYLWSRNIREVVEYYGNAGWGANDIDDKKYNANKPNRKGSFYTGMAPMIVSTQIMMRINGPLSSTKSYEVACRFATGDVIVIYLDNMSFVNSWRLSH